MMRFECAKCGGCCRQGGDLRLLPEDVEKLARHFGAGIDEIKMRYGMKSIDSELFFIPYNGNCPFLAADNRCELHGDAKPFFCANYVPFLDRKGSPIYKVCRGIGHGREWSDEEIAGIYEEMLERLVIRR